MNKVILIGRLGKDPEQRIVGGKTVASFSMATTEKWKVGERTEWHNVVAWDKLAEFIKQYCIKGDMVGVEGEIRYETYDKDGEKKYTTKIYIQRLDKLTWEKKDEPKKAATLPAKKYNKDDDIDDDVQF